MPRLLTYDKREIFLTAGLLVSLGMAAAWAHSIREIEVKPDPPEAEAQLVTVRFLPDETALYDQIVFDCTLQQELALTLADGGRTNKTFDAGFFTARQRDVKMVKSLDCYVSFFVQLGNKRSAETPGGAATNAPVKVARIKITAYRKGKKDWTVKTGAEGKYRAADEPADPNDFIKVKE